MVLSLWAMVRIVQSLKSSLIVFWWQSERGVSMSSAPRHSTRRTRFGNVQYLNEVVRLQVDGRRGLVEQEYLRLAQEGARQADQLPLADTATVQRQGE